MTPDKTPRYASDVTVAPSTAPASIEAAAHIAGDITVISVTPPLSPQTIIGGPLPTELAQSMIGQQLGDITLDEFVGGGGMGSVFRGTDTKLHRTVAVKVLTNHHADDDESHRRFQMEARSAARLDHPNIARVHFVGEERGLRYLVFEYIEGQNVRDLVHAHGPFSLPDALRYMLQIGDALMHAWQRDVVHRDIKPSNILLTPEGQAKLVDMGLARFEDADPHEHELTSSGVTLGTFDYMAPEQARDSRHADIRSDIYSLGCTFFFMLVGKPPFANGTALQKLLQHQADEPPNLQQFRPDVPESVVEVIDTMLAKRPADRFQNPAELLAALIAVTEQLGLTYPQISLPTGLPVAPVQTTWLRRHAPWLIPAALLGLSVLGLGMFWSQRQPAEEFPALQTEHAAGDQADAVRATKNGTPPTTPRK